MKINDEHVVKEMKKLLELIKDAYRNSDNSSCDRKLANVIGRLEILISVLSVTDEE